MPGSGSDPLLSNTVPMPKTLSQGTYNNSATLNKSYTSSEKPEEVLDVQKIMNGEDTRTYTMIRHIPVKYTQKQLEAEFE